MSVYWLAAEIEGDMSHPGFSESSLTCHPEARRAEGTENVPFESISPGSFSRVLGIRMTG
jgi:hypothetical protein